MRNKLLIASVALSGLMSAQCNYKCGYNQDENGNTVHLKQCNEYKETYQDVFNKHKTDKCQIAMCLILIVNNDTICWNHDKKAVKEVQKQLGKNGDWYSHHQFERPEGSPYGK
tara:strand:+ start:270 stop:608 length:339 start_codon:yes stop_codon:yes gene_type:complete